MRISDRVTTLEAILPGIHEQLKALNEKMTGLDHVIRGNGSPGLVQTTAEIKLRVETIEGGRNRWRDAFFTVAGGIVVGVSLFLFSKTWSHYEQPSVQSVQQK